MLILAYRKDEAELKSREVGVMFENLRVVGLGSSSSYQSTFGSLFDPFVMLEKIQNLRHPPIKDILTDFEGTVKPGEMLCEIHHLLLVSQLTVVE
jgi:ATP-binding cassette, subfamily G (WHITE), member 2, SNQ2